MYPVRHRDVSSSSPMSVLVSGVFPPLHYAGNEPPMCERGEVRHHTVQSEQLSVLSTQEMFRRRNVERRYVCMCVCVCVCVRACVCVCSVVTLCVVRCILQTRQLLLESCGLLLSVVMRYVQCVANPLHRPSLQT